MWTLYADDSRTDGDDATRTATVTTTGGQVSTRPYTVAENATADAMAAALSAQAFRDTLTDTATLQGRLTRLAAYDTDADLAAVLNQNNNTAMQTAALNRALKTMVRREKRLSATLALVVRLIDPVLLVDISDTADA